MAFLKLGSCTQHGLLAQHPFRSICDAAALQVIFEAKLAAVSTADARPEPKQGHRPADAQITQANAAGKKQRGNSAASGTSPPASRGGRARICRLVQAAAATSRGHRSDWEAKTRLWVGAKPQSR